ncbi:MAG: ATP-binding protein [Bryobacterales bacterium]|nr:ATP-binding protein [Bryobacterales bacterium]
MSSASVLSKENPFPGLRPYEEEDADWFFGRGGEINELLKRLRRVHFLAVVGPSGCGKSSLIKAGVLPGVRDGYLDAEWKIASIRPGEKPMDNLAAALSAMLGGDIPAIRRKLDAGCLGIVEAWKEQKSDTKVLVLVDQFEELFQFVQRRGDPAQEETKAFLKLLLTAAAAEPSIYIILTMRVEWLAECASYMGLSEAINEGIYLVPQMSRRQFQQVILGPVEAAGGTIVSSLLDRLLNDLDNRTDQLPVLQHALMRIWSRHAPGSALDISIYEAAGTLSRCLSDHAEEIFAELSSDQQKTAECLFRSITQVSKSRKTRRPRPLSEAAPGSPPEQVKSVVDAFRREGRSFLVVTPGPLQPDSIVDISHEALIRQWRRLNQWVDREAEVQARITRLRETAAEWDHEGRTNRDLLYRGTVLQQAWELRPLLLRDGAAGAFLDTSRRRQRHLGFLKIGLVIAFFFLILGWGVSTLREKAADADLARQQAEFSAQQVQREQEHAKEIADLLARLALKEQKRSPQLYASIQASIEKLQAKRIYLQYPLKDQIPAVMNVQSALNKAGYDVPKPEFVGGKAPPQSQVRYFYAKDKSEAEKIAGLLHDRLHGGIAAHFIANTKNVVPVGQFEIWFSLSAFSRAAD